MLNVVRRLALVTAFSTALARASPFSIDGNATEPKSSSDAAVRRVRLDVNRQNVVGDVPRNNFQRHAVDLAQVDRCKCASHTA